MLKNFDENIPRYDWLQLYLPHELSGLKGETITFPIKIATLLSSTKMWYLQWQGSMALQINATYRAAAIILPFVPNVYTLQLYTYNAHGVIARSRVKLPCLQGNNSNSGIANSVENKSHRCKNLRDQTEWSKQWKKYLMCLCLSKTQALPFYAFRQKRALGSILPLLKEALKSQEFFQPAFAAKSKHPAQPSWKPIANNKNKRLGLIPSISTGKSKRIDSQLKASLANFGQTEQKLYRTSAKKTRSNKLSIYKRATLAIQKADEYRVQSNYQPIADKQFSRVKLHNNRALSAQPADRRAKDAPHNHAAQSVAEQAREDECRKQAALEAQRAAVFLKEDEEFYFKKISQYENEIRYLTIEQVKKNQEQENINQSNKKLIEALDNFINKIDISVLNEQAKNNQAQRWLSQWIQDQYHLIKKSMIHEVKKYYRKNTLIAVGNPTYYDDDNNFEKNLVEKIRKIESLKLDILKIETAIEYTKKNNTILKNSMEYLKSEIENFIKTDPLDDQGSLKYSQLKKDKRQYLERMRKRLEIKDKRLKATTQFVIHSQCGFTEPDEVSECRITEGPDLWWIAPMPSAFDGS